MDNPKTKITIIIEQQDESPDHPWGNWDPRSGEECPDNYDDDPSFDQYVRERLD